MAGEAWKVEFFLRHVQIMPGERWGQSQVPDSYSVALGQAKEGGDYTFLTLAVYVLQMKYLATAEITMIAMPT